MDSIQRLQLLIMKVTLNRSILLQEPYYCKNQA